MKTSELTGALLDYWVARAEGVEDKDIFWRQAGDFWTEDYEFGFHPSSDWEQGGPLIEKYAADIGGSAGDWWFMAAEKTGGGAIGEGITLLQAVCRAVVRAKFGDEVPDQENAQ